MNKRQARNARIVQAARDGASLAEIAEVEGVPLFAAFKICEAAGLRHSPPPKDQPPRQPMRAVFQTQLFGTVEVVRMETGQFRVMIPDPSGFDRSYPKPLAFTVNQLGEFDLGGRKFYILWQVIDPERAVFGEMIPEAIAHADITPVASSRPADRSDP